MVPVKCLELLLWMGQMIQIQPGESTHATVKALYEPMVSYDELVKGSRFEILEGARVVGHGEVVRR